MGQAAARARAERINFHLISTYAARRARIGEGQGERSPAGAARGRMELARITETLPQNQGVIEMTRPGFHTARRRVPAVLRRMDEADPRRIAAHRYAVAVEKIGAMAGASYEGAQADGGAATNDGGVTTRIRHAATINAAHKVAALLGVVLAPRARGGTGHRRHITARTLLDAVCIDGADMKSVLTGAGWSGQRRDVATLTGAAEEGLEALALALGLIDPAARAPGTETALAICDAMARERGDLIPETAKV